MQSCPFKCMYVYCILLGYWEDFLRVFFKIIVTFDEMVLGYFLIIYRGKKPHFNCF